MLYWPLSSCRGPAPGRSARWWPMASVTGWHGRAMHRRRRAQQVLDFRPATPRSDPANNQDSAVSEGEWRGAHQDQPAPEFTYSIFNALADDQKKSRVEIGPASTRTATPSTWGAVAVGYPVQTGGASGVRKTLPRRRYGARRLHPGSDCHRHPRSRSAHRTVSRFVDFQLHD
jgi:hypothetical protein